MAYLIVLDIFAFIVNIFFVDKFTGKLASYINTISQEQKGLFDDLCYNYVNLVVSLVIMLAILTSVNWQTGAIFFVGVMLMLIVGRYTIRNSTRSPSCMSFIMKLRAW